MSWISAAFTAISFSGRQAKKWWRNQDLGRNLSQAVIAALDARRNLASGIREELVSQWLAVRDDEHVTALVRRLIDDRTADDERVLERRINELLRDLDLKLGVDETARILTATVLENLAEAQPTPELRNRAYFTHVDRNIDASAETGHAILALLEERLPPAAETERVGENSSSLQTPSQLPRDIADFTDREGEQEVLIAALSAAPERAPVVATISGMPGIGKSALAIRVAHTVADSFSDGQLYADLGVNSTARSTNDVLADFLRALGAEHVPPELEQRSALFRHMSRNRRLLVVVDNAKQEHDVRPLVPADEKCAIVITGRSPLVALEGVSISCPLDVLDDEAARELLVTVLGDQERADGEPAAANEIVFLCGCLPLAIRIAGARLRARPRWTLAEFAARLAGEHRRLDELQAGDRAVRASIALSYDDLEEQCAQLFRRLGLLRGPSFDASVSAALLGVSEDESRGLLESLADAQLVNVIDDDRYSFHDLVRIFAGERLTDEDNEDATDAALDRALGWYLDLVLDDNAPGESSRTEPGTPTLLPKIAYQRGNLLAAVELAYERGRWFATWALALGLSPFYERSGHWDEWRHSHELALDAVSRLTIDQIDPDAPNPSQMTAMAASRLGLVYLLERRSEDAIACHTRALAAATQDGDRRGEISELSNLGNAYAQAGRMEDAIDQFEQSLWFATEEGDRAGEAAALNNLGIVMKDLRRVDEARSYYSRSLEIKEELDDGLGQARTLANLGFLARGAGDWDHAAALYMRSVTLYRAASDVHGAAMSEMDIGALQADRGEWHAAMETLERVIATFTEIGDRFRVGGTHLQLSDLAKNQNDYAGAISHATAALEIFRQLGTPDAEAKALNALALTYTWQGHLAEAIEHYQANLVTFGDLGNVKGKAGTLGNLGTAYWFSGDIERSLASYEASIALFRELNDRYGEALSRNSVGKILTAQNRLREAREHLTFSLDVFRQIGDRPAEGHALGNVAELHAAEGDLKAAAEYYAQAVAIKRELGDTQGEAHLLVDLGSVVEAAGDQPQADAIWRQALTLPQGLTAAESAAARERIST